MWNDQSAQGGGFFNSPSQFGATNTPNANAGKSGGRRASRIAPIVIKQALHSGEDGVRIWGTEIQIVSIVARVRNIRMQSTKITYTLQDMTGQMSAISWINQDDGEEDEKVIPKIIINSYVQVFGHVKMNRGVKQLVLIRIQPVTSANTITFHYLQCIHNKIRAETESKKDKPMNTGASFAGGLPSNSMVGVGDSNGTAAGFNPRQTLVFNLIRASHIEQGTSKIDMLNSLKDRMSQIELENILEWMCSEGHIYSTIDEDHFRATDPN